MLLGGQQVQVQNLLKRRTVGLAVNFQGYSVVDIPGKIDVTLFLYSCTYRIATSGPLIGKNNSHLGVIFGKCLPQAMLNTLISSTATLLHNAPPKKKKQ